jgi:hypothetical protein
MQQVTDEEWRALRARMAGQVRQGMASPPRHRVAWWPAGSARGAACLIVLAASGLALTAHLAAGWHVSWGTALSRVGWFLAWPAIAAVLGARYKGGGKARRRF